VSPEVGVLDEEAFHAAYQHDPDAAMTMLVEMGSATDERLRAEARRLARQLVLDLARHGAPRARGVRRLRRGPAELGGELDLDASLGALVEARAGGRLPGADELVTRHWEKPDLALCLVIDTSGSMTGARLAAAALTAAACAWRAPAEHAIVSFARETRTLRPLWSDRPASAVVDSILTLRGHGVTALTSALQAASDQLARSRAARRVVVLLSDCRATDEQDPVPVARRMPELVILAPADDCAQAEELARRSGGRWAPLSGAAGAPATLARLLDR
jgi:Mg-chelatase subunit ChlD